MGDHPLERAVALAQAAEAGIDSVATAGTRPSVLALATARAEAAQAWAAVARAPHPDGYEHRDDCPCRCVTGGALDETAVWLPEGLIFELMVAATKLGGHADTLPAAYAAQAEAMRVGVSAIREVLKATPGVTVAGDGGPS